jgi:hypothetical protein
MDSDSLLVVPSTCLPVLMGMPCKDHCVCRGTSAAVSVVVRCDGVQRFCQ